MPFTTFDEETSSPKWYSILSGSRLRNRALSIAASFVGFILILLLIRRLAYSGNSIPLHDTGGLIKPGLSTHIYEGEDIDSVHSALTDLIVVAGHAIWLGGSSYKNDADWILESYQREQTHTFIEHIRKGATLAQENPHSLLIFSGGETRHAAGARSESQSYTALFQLLEAETPILNSIERVTTEEFARDSYENLIFSIARFFEVTGRYPERISVIGFAFKQTRFVEIHRKAVKFPADKFHYYGIDPPGISDADIAGEISNARALFDQDLYGCRSEVLLGKKKERNPGRRRHGYEVSNPAIAELLDYCPTTGSEVYPGQLPWT